MARIQKYPRRQIAFWTLALVAGGLGASGCRMGAAGAATRGQEVFQNCVPCHNADGSGNPDVGAPNIAGMKQWYVQAQLQNFRSGVRGMHFNDVEGMRMRPMAMSLASEEDVRAVARYVETLPRVTHAATVKGDAHVGDTPFHAICSS